MKRLTTLLLLVAPLMAVGAEPIPADKMQWLQAVMDDIYRMRYEEAAETSRNKIATQPEDPAGHLLLARTYWSQEMAREHAFSISRFAAPEFFAEKQQGKYKIQIAPAAEKRFLETSAEAIERAKVVLRKEPQNPEAMFLLGLAYQNEVTFHASTKGGWWDAFRAGQKTYSRHRKVRASFPGFEDALLAMGVYEYVAGSVPWSIRWLNLFLFGSGGSKKVGRRMLETAASDAKLVADDARTILALIYAREKKYEASFSKLTELGEKYPENYLFQIDRSTLARLMDRPQLAADILGALVRNNETGSGEQSALERAEIFTHLGLAFRDMGDVRAAENWFRIALEEPDLSSRVRAVAKAELDKTLQMQ